MKTSNKILLAVGIVLAAFLIYYQMRFQHFKIATTSMHNSLYEGDILLFDKHYDTIKVNSMVAFNAPSIGNPICSRVVGCPNDTVKIVDGVLWVNSKIIDDKNTQYEYNISGEIEFNEKLLLERKILLEPFCFKDEYGTYYAYLSEGNVKRFTEMKGVDNAVKIIHPKGYQYLNSEISIFPNHKDYNWSRDNFGRVIVPAMGVEVELNKDNLPIYYELIFEETGGSRLEIEQLKNYTFEENYYFMMSDNRHNAIDSRYFGFVSRADIIGVYSLTIYSPN